MRTTAGVVLFALGLVTADNSIVVIPFGLVLAGMWLLKGVITDDRPESDL